MSQRHSNSHDSEDGNEIDYDETIAFAAELHEELCNTICFSLVSESRAEKACIHCTPSNNGTVIRGVLKGVRTHT